MIINHRDLNDDGSLYGGEADDSKDKCVNEELGKDDPEMGKINMMTLTTGQPLDAIGGLAAPHLPAHHPYKQPATNLEVRK